MKNHKPISEKKLLANRQNALKSTGPTTEAGKAVASRNATTHGMTARALPLPPDEQRRYEERTAAFTRAARPADEIEEWLVTAAANASLRVDRCRRCEQAELADRRDEAVRRWRRGESKEVARMVAQFPGAPSLVVAELEEHSRGCEWLLARWAELHRSLRRGQALRGEELELALRLLGHDPARGTPSFAIDAALAEQEIERLSAQRERVWEESDRRKVGEAIDVSAVDTGERALLRRRYESAAWNDLNRALNQLEKRQKASARGEVEVAAEPAPGPRAELRNEPTETKGDDVTSHSNGRSDTPKRDRERPDARRDGLPLSSYLPIEACPAVAPAGCLTPASP